MDPATRAYLDECRSHPRSRKELRRDIAEGILLGVFAAIGFAATVFVVALFAMTVAAQLLGR